MSRNIRLLITYDGSNYCGWQRQNNASTIQGTIEKCLTTLTTEHITLHGAGRTDAGVHALGMTAHFHTKSKIISDNFTRALNSMLPVDIRIINCHEVSNNFHSRFNAIAKSYRYNFFTGSIQSPVNRLYVTHYPFSLNVDNITTCLAILIGTHNFASFEASGSRDVTLNGRGAIRTLYQAKYYAVDNSPDTYSFFFNGNGFLRHMVRNIVGTLIEVGKNKISPQQFSEIFKSNDRNNAGPTAPAKGLSLVKVHYDHDQTS